MLADEHGSADGDEHNAGGDENDAQTGAAEKQGDDHERPKDKDPDRAQEAQPAARVGGGEDAQLAGIALRLAQPEPIAEQLDAEEEDHDEDHQHHGEVVAVREKGDRIAPQLRHLKIEHRRQHAGDRDRVAEHIALLGALHRFDLHDGLGLDGHGVKVLIVENVRVAALRNDLPARAGAVVPKGQVLVVWFVGTKAVGLGVVDHREAELFRLAAAVAQGVGADGFKHPAVGGHFLQVPLESRVVVEGVEVQFSLLVPSVSSHGLSPPFKSRW